VLLSTDGKYCAYVTWARREHSLRIRPVSALSSGPILGKTRMQSAPLQLSARLSVRRQGTHGWIDGPYTDGFTLSDMAQGFSIEL
jgi:hypothetical protein